jgi:hypothetical protein
MLLPKAQISFPTKPSPINIEILAHFQQASILSREHHISMNTTAQHAVNYNETLRKVHYTTHQGKRHKLTKFQISNSLENALDTFGPSSRQYQTILGMLKECLHDIENERQVQNNAQVVDADMLSLAMGFLDIGK